MVRGHAADHEDQQDTKLEYLVLCALAQVVKWYKSKAKRKQLLNLTLSHTTLT